MQPEFYLKWDIKSQLQKSTVNLWEIMLQLWKSHNWWVINDRKVAIVTLWVRKSQLQETKSQLVDLNSQLQEANISKLPLWDIKSQISIWPIPNSQIPNLIYYIIFFFLVI